MWGQHPHVLRPRNYPSFRWLQFGGRLVAVLRPSIDESIIEEDHFITMIALLEPKLASVLGLVLNCLWSSRSMDIPA